MEFIKVPLTAQMKRDYEECAEMADDGQEKDCACCSMNGGAFACMGEYHWCKED
ncbi:MAG: hypothetical protein UFG06_13955 [Lachnospiraceae bacterium]|nr:hypothetical protein [Lachnospiraceae bacterium]